MYEWHPVSQKHESASGKDITVALHEKAGLGKDGMGGNTASRTMMGADEKPESPEGGEKPGSEEKPETGTEGEGGEGGGDEQSQESDDGFQEDSKLKTAGKVAALGASMIGKNILMSAGSLTDAAMGGMRRVMSAMMSGNPMSASAKALTGTLENVGNISSEMSNIQRKYGIGAGKDSGTLESTIAGSMMLGDQKDLKHGTATGMANVSRAIEGCGAENIETMNAEQLGKVTAPLSEKAKSLMDELTADRQKPSKERMPRSEYKRKYAELKVYADTLKGVAARSKEVKSDHKEYAARLSHQMQYKAAMNAEIKRQNKYEMERRAQNRYNNLPPSGKLISDKVGSKVALDEDGIPINRSKRTAAKNVLIDEADSLDRRIEKLSANNNLSPEEEQEIKYLSDLRDGYRNTVSEITNRETKEKEARREANRRSAIEGKQPGNSTASAIMDKAHVYESGKYVDQYGATTGMKNTPQLRNDLGEAIKAREGEALRQAADNGLDISNKDVRDGVLSELQKDPDYVELKSTLSANAESHYKDVVTRQLRDVLSMSDRDIDKTYGGKVDRDMIEQTLRDVEEQYHRNRMASPLRQGEDPSYQAVMPKRENEEAFSRLMDDTVKKYGLKPLASPRVKKPNDEEAVPQDAVPGTDQNQNDGDAGAGADNGVVSDQQAGTQDQTAQAASEGTQEQSAAGTASEQAQQTHGTEGAQAPAFEGAPTISKPGRNAGSGYTSERILDQTLKQNGNDMNTRFILDDDTLDDLIMNEPQRLLGAVKGFNKGEAWKGVRGMDSYLNSNMAYMESKLGKWTGQDTSQMTPEQIVGAYYNEAKKRGDEKKAGRAINFANLLKMRNAYDRVEQRSEGVSPTKPFQYNRPTGEIPEDVLRKYGLADYYNGLGDAGKAEINAMDEHGLKDLGKKVKANQRKARDEKDQRIMDRPEASRDDKPTEYDRAIMLGIAMDHDLNIRPGMSNKELRSMLSKNRQAWQVYQNTEKDRKAQKAEWNAKYKDSEIKPKAPRTPKAPKSPKAAEPAPAEETPQKTESTEQKYQDTAKLSPSEFNKALLYEIASKAGLNVSQDMDTATLQNLVNKHPQLKEVYDGTKELRKKHAKAYASLLEGEKSSGGTQTPPEASPPSTDDSEGKNKKWNASVHRASESMLKQKKNQKPAQSEEAPAEEEKPKFGSLQEMNDAYSRDINDYADMQGYEVPANLRGSFPDFMSFITSGSPEAEMYMGQYEGDRDLMDMLSDYKQDEKDLLARQKPRHGSRMNRDPENKKNPLKN